MHTALARLAVAHRAEPKQFLLSFFIPMCRWILYCLNLLPFKDKKTMGGVGEENGATRHCQTLVIQVLSRLFSYKIGLDSSHKKHQQRSLALV